MDELRNGIDQSRIWEDGAWKDGTWKFGYWFDGAWENGTWRDGIWYNGTWEKGTWKTGWILDSDKKGNFEKDWEWDGNFVKSSINPRDYFDPNYMLKRNINMLEDN